MKLDSLAGGGVFLLLPFLLSAARPDAQDDKSDGEHDGEKEEDVEDEDGHDGEEKPAADCSDDTSAAALLGLALGDLVDGGDIAKDQAGFGLYNSLEVLVVVDGLDDAPAEHALGSELLSVLSKCAAEERQCEKEGAEEEEKGSELLGGLLHHDLVVELLVDDFNVGDGLLAASGDVGGVGGHEVADALVDVLSETVLSTLSLEPMVVAWFFVRRVGGLGGGDRVFVVLMVLMVAVVLSVAVAILVHVEGVGGQRFLCNGVLGVLEPNEEVPLGNPLSGMGQISRTVAALGEENKGPGLLHRLIIFSNNLQGGGGGRGGIKGECNLKDRLWHGTTESDDVSVALLTSHHSGDKHFLL